MVHKMQQIMNYKVNDDTKSDTTFDDVLAFMDITGYADESDAAGVSIPAIMAETEVELV